MIDAQFAQHVRTQTERYDQALAAAGFDAAMVHAGALHIQFQDDAAYPFKPNPMFKAWVPLCAHPDSFVVYQPGSRPQLIYFQPDDYWHKPPDDPSGFWTDAFDIEVVRKAEDARQFVPQGRIALLAEEPARFESWAFTGINPDALINPLHFARAWKTDYEIACMEEASRLGVAAHRAAKDAFEAGASEYEIHLAYCKACGHAEEELPYSNIIALNSHGAVLHYTHRDRKPPRESRSFLIDAGASCNGYASDITRTYSAADGRFADLIERVDRMQLSLCERLAPGADYVSVHIEAHRLIGGLLAEAGIVRASADDAVTSGLTALFYPHGLGHYIGLQVHDVGGFMADPVGTHKPPPAAHPFLRLTRTLDAGQVMTVEPGVYFIPSLLEPERGTNKGKAIDWALIDELYPYGGIRIEDDVLITDDGVRNLTREAFAA